MFKRPSESPYRCLLRSWFRALPGKHCSCITIQKCILLCCIQPLESVVDQNFSEIGVEDKNCRVHPQVHIPENMSIVSKTTESHGTETIASEPIDEGVAMIDHWANILLILVVALDDDVALPKGLPFSVVPRNDGVRVHGLGPDYHADGFIDRIIMIFIRHQASDYNEIEDISLLQWSLELLVVKVWVPILVQDPHILLVGEMERSSRNQCEFACFCLCLAGHDVVNANCCVNLLLELLKLD